MNSTLHLALFVIYLRDSWAWWCHISILSQLWRLISRCQVCPDLLLDTEANTFSPVEIEFGVVSLPDPDFLLGVAVVLLASFFQGSPARKRWTLSTREGCGLILQVRVLEKVRGTWDEDIFEEAERNGHAG